MDGLTAKVFRTHRACLVMQTELTNLTSGKESKPKSKLHLNEIKQF